MTPLSHWEQVALVASVIFKFHARYPEANNVSGIGRKNWGVARKSLQDKGLLDHRFTPTAAGMEWSRGKRLDFMKRRVVG